MTDLCYFKYIHAMQFKIFAGFFVMVFLCAITTSCTEKNSGREISALEFKDPPKNVMINTWWHWLDGNITREGITKDLEAMKAQGVVQATILNVGLFGDRDFGVPKVKFGSDEWFGMFRWALREAERLNIKIGAHNCDGWSSSGGPWVTPEMSMKQFVWTKTIISGGQEVNIGLKEPFSIKDFYRDVAVVAVRTGEKKSAFQSSSPKVTLNRLTDASWITDGCPVSGIEVKKGDYVEISFPEPLSFKRIAIHPHRSFMWGDAVNFVTSCSVLVSDDGKKYRRISDFSIKGLNKTEYMSVPLTASRFVRVAIDGCGSGENSTVEIAELELLNDGENALFSPSVPYLSEKTSSVMSGKEDIFYTPGSGHNFPSSADIIVLTDKMGSDGTLHWDAPEGNWAVLRFGYTSTGATNGPATREGVGLECDKMDTAAIDLHFRSWPLKLIAQAGEYAGNTFKFLLIDSWECGFQNWTAAFPVEFQKRRGYDLIPYIPVLCGEIVNTQEESEAVLFDFRKTIADLIEQNYYERFSDLCHHEKVEMHAEVIYGNPTYPPLDILKSTKCVDLPMFEFWTSTDSNMFIKYQPSAGPEFNMPACAVTGYNKFILGSEAYTGFAHYSESPYELKPFGDRAFCSGISQMILHSYVHQPNDRKPGMTLGQFASHFNRNNLYWQFISGWFDYQARIQYVLQKGTASPDVLYFLGDQLPQSFVQNSSTTLPPGYQLNACNYDILSSRVRVADGKLKLNDAGDYAVLSLPDDPCMNYETLQLIGNLIEQGAIVYGPRPLYTLSREDLTENKDAFQKLADKIWGNADCKKVTMINYGKGKVFWGIPLEEAFNQIGLKPDFSTNQPENNTFQFIHKKMDNMEVYFVANQLDTTVNRECLFRSDGKIPEIWDPETGKIVKPSIFSIEDGIIRLPFCFKPFQSVLFVFKRGEPSDYITSVTENGSRIFPAPSGSESHEVPMVTFEGDGMKVTVSSTGDYEFITYREKHYSGKYTLPEESEINSFTGTIKFEPGYQASIDPVEITSLKSLTEYDNPDIRYFAGNAIYTIDFRAPEDFVGNAQTVSLNIGNFGAVAEITLNGKSLGRIWKPGTELDVTGLLKPDNQLVVNVANVYRNRFIGDFIQYGKVQSIFTSSPITQFLDKDRPLKPSGLMGPLKLTMVPEAVLR
jgi:hypothetical protein